MPTVNHDAPPSHTSDDGSADENNSVDPATIDLRTADSKSRGRDADAPGEIPARGWMDVARRVMAQVKTDNVVLLAAGIAFFGLLSLIPALIAAVSVYGLVSSPADVARQVEELTASMPAEARDLLKEQLDQIASTSEGSLSIAALLGVLGALWAASAAGKHVLVALSAVYDEKETRGFVALRLRAIAVTVSALFVGALCVLVIVVVPAWIRSASQPLGIVASVVRWPVVATVVVAALALVYRYGPDRAEPRWRWVSWGSAIATVTWVLAAAAFSLYAGRFGSYNSTYGSLAGVVLLMLWLMITAACVLIGAEINAELEHQTVKDSTTGAPRPMGDRDSYVADTVGEARSA